MICRAEKRLARVSPTELPLRNEFNRGKDISFWKLCSALFRALYEHVDAEGVCISTIKNTCTFLVVTRLVAYTT